MPHFYNNGINEAIQGIVYIETFKQFIFVAVYAKRCRIGVIVNSSLGDFADCAGLIVVL